MQYIDIHRHPPLSNDNGNVISIVDISSIDPSAPILSPYCSLGIHPWFLTEENSALRLHHLERLLQNNTIVAIGEAGLDTMRGAEMDIQQRIFDKVVSLSEQYQKTLIIHCVKAWDKLLALHKNRKVTQTWIVHGFHGSHELASQLLKRKIMLSFGIKLLKDNKLQSTFSKIPINALFLETDDANINIADVYQAAAAIKGITGETLKRRLFENFVIAISL